MSSQNESILRYLKSIVVGNIIDQEKINVGSIIIKEILMRASQKQTFTILITQHCEATRVPYKDKSDVRVTYVSSMKFKS